MTLDHPLVTDLDSSSVATVVPWEGRSIIAGNTFINGTSLQFYGTATDLVLAENTLTHMVNSLSIHPGGINVFSLKYVTGYQPNLRVEVRNNTVMHTNGCNFLEANLPTIDPPLTRGFVSRGNRVGYPLQDGTSTTYGGILISGRATAGVVEGNVMTHGSKITISPATTNVVQRNNVEQ